MCAVGCEVCPASICGRTDEKVDVSWDMAGSVDDVLVDLRRCGALKTVAELHPITAGQRVSMTASARRDISR